MLAGLLLLTTAACASQEPDQPTGVGFEDLSDDGFHGAALTTPYAVLDRPLRDTSGASYSLVVDTDRPLTLVFFGYTHCPDVCQIMMSTVASGLTRLPAEQRSLVDVVVVTTDPARDDERALRRWLDHFDPGFIGLTGSLSDIVAVAEPLKVYVEKGEQLPSGGYEVEHGTPVLGIDSQDRASIVWTEGTSPVQLAEDISALLSKA
jgi:protein SCO1